MTELFEIWLTNCHFLKVAAAQKIRGAHPAFVQRWSTVYDVGPTSGVFRVQKLYVSIHIYFYVNIHITR